MSSEAMDAKLLTIMERMCQLGRLLPAADDLDLDDADEMAEAKIVLAEFQKAEAEMWALLKERW